MPEAGALHLGDSLNESGRIIAVQVETLGSELSS
jgi:hypothetical protein